MKTAFHWKRLKYAFWLGPVLVIMGLTAGLVAGDWGPLPLGLLIAGIVLVGLWLILESTTLPGVWQRRSTQAGTNALIATLALIVILGLVNFLAVRYIQRIDLTENQLFTLAPQTQTVIENLQQPVKIWIFEQTPDPFERELLDNVRRQNELLSYEYVDPQVEPQISSRFGVQAFGEVYLESGDEQRLIKQGNSPEPLSERQLANGILQITSDRQTKVYFVQGHGEKPLEPGQNGLSQAIAELQDENYITEPLNLAESPGVPEDASVIVLAGPTQALLDAEVQALDAYLDRQSGLLLMVDPGVQTGLDDLYDEWNLRITNRLIIDPGSRPPTVPIISNYGDHPITQDFANNFSLYPESQPIDLISEPEDITATPLLLTSDRVQTAEIGEDGTVQLDPDSPPEGPLVLGAALNRPVEADTPSPEQSPEAADDTEDDETAEFSPEARLVVIGNSTFATDGLFGEVLNGDVFLNSVSWLSQDDEQILSIRSKEPTNRRIILNQQQLVIIALTAVAILPVLGFGGAIALWLRRR
ncbi:MAG: GldG family protein [Elainellaceae cyanobacterium]